MPITRPTIKLLAKAELNDDYGVDLTVTAGNVTVCRRLTSIEAAALADELAAAAYEAESLAHAEATA